MSAAKILILILAINSLLYLSGAQLFTQDIFDHFGEVNGDVVVSYGGFGESLPSDISGSTGNLVTDGDGFSFWDSIGIVVDTIVFLLNIVLAPLALFVGSGMPLFLQLMLGVPIGILYAFGIVMLIRGVGQ